MTPEEKRELLHRRAAEVRAQQAGEQLASVADEVREALALHDAKLGALDTLMRETVAALQSEPEPEKPRHLRLVRDTEAS